MLFRVEGMAVTGKPFSKTGALRMADLLKKSLRFILIDYIIIK
jgi:hypothetical protein